MSRSRCPCGKVRGVDGLCPYGCEAFRRPVDRIRAAERGRKAPVERYLTTQEASAGAARAGIPMVEVSTTISPWRRRRHG